MHILRVGDFYINLDNILWVKITTDADGEIVARVLMQTGNMLTLEGDDVPSFLASLDAIAYTTAPGKWA